MGSTDKGAASAGVARKLRFDFFFLTGRKLFYCQILNPISARELAAMAGFDDGAWGREVASEMRVAHCLN